LYRQSGFAPDLAGIELLGGKVTLGRQGARRAGIFLCVPLGLDLVGQISFGQYIFHRQGITAHLAVVVHAKVWRDGGKLRPIMALA
jgi:hypothetical protein